MGRLRAGRPARRLASWVPGKRWRSMPGCGTKRSRRADGGLWPRGGKSRRTRLDFARRKERQTRLGKLLLHPGA